MTEVPGLIAAWEQARSKLCLHERTAEEYHLTTPTGDVVCLDCGDAWPKDADKPLPRE